MRRRCTLRHLLVRAGIAALALVAAALAIAAGAIAVRRLGSALPSYDAFEGLAVAAIAFTFVVLTTPRVLRSLAERSPERSG